MSTNATRLRYSVKPLLPLFTEYGVKLSELATESEVAALNFGSERDLPDTIEHCTVALQPNRGRLLVKSTSQDCPPILTWKIALKAHADDCLEATALIPSPPVQGAARLYWSHGLGFTEMCACTLKAGRDRSAALGNFTGWRGRIRRIRLDLYPPGHEYNIGPLRFVRGGASHILEEWDGTIKVNLGNDWCNALPLRVPSSSSARIQIPAGARIRGRVGAAIQRTTKQALEVRLGFALDEQPQRWLASWHLLAGQSGGWHEFDVDLSEFADTSGTLMLEAAAGGRKSTHPRPVVYWGNLRLLTPDEGEAPDVVFVSLDALRRDHVGACGGPPSLTPVLDRIATDGVVCEQATAPGTSTLISHTSLFTGVAPMTHGVFGKGNKCRSQSDAPRLPQLLAEHGYQPVALTDSALMDVVFQGSGFAVYAQTSRNPLDALDDKSPFKVDDDLLITLEAAGRLLNEHRDERLFLFAHTYYVHDYYTDYHSPAKPASDQHGAEMLSRLMTAIKDGACFLRDEEWETVKSLYAARVRRMDEAIGKLAWTLVQHGRYERTFLVFFSDHGEELNDHGGALHSRSAYRELTDIPLVLKFPRNEWAGARITVPTSLMDLYPALLDLAGIERVAGLEGDSLVELLRSEAGAPSERRVSSAAIIDEVYALAFRQGWWKYIYDGRTGWDEVYHVIEDPTEQRNLLRTDPGAVEPRLLRSWRDATLEQLSKPWGWHLVLRGQPGETLWGRLDSPAPFGIMGVFRTADDFWLRAPDRRFIVFRFRFDAEPVKALFFRQFARFTLHLKRGSRDLPVEEIWFGPDDDRSALGAAAMPLTLESKRFPPGRPAAPSGERAAVLCRVMRPGKERQSAPEPVPKAVVEHLRALGYVD